MTHLKNALNMVLSTVLGLIVVVAVALTIGELSYLLMTFLGEILTVVVIVFWIWVSYHLGNRLLEAWRKHGESNV